MHRFTGFLLVCLLVAFPAFSQESFAPINYETARLSRIVTAVRVNEEMSLDGRLEERGWSLAIPATDFITKSPREGRPSTERTEARFLYDEDNLYIGFNAFDSDVDHMVINELKEDFNFQQNDVVSVTIDSLHDRRSGFFFNVNPVGAKRDGQIFNDGQQNPDWDGVWDAKTSTNSEGWIAEIVIPFKTLRFSQAASQEWGVNVGRRVTRANEESQWAPIPQRFGGLKISMAGTLKGLENIHQGRNLKVKPFFTAGVTQLRSTTTSELQTLRSLTRFKDYDGGVDGKYSITPSITLDTTYRTDFAQVEVDQQQVNLTRFNVFFPEKRDFFLENSGTFAFGGGGGGSSNNLVPFFSRRIGLSSAGAPIPIVGGARLTGKVGNYDLGFLAMKTEKFVTSAATTPSNNYLVGRVKRNLLTRSWVGGIITDRESALAGDYNRVYGTDAFFVFYDKLEIDSYFLKSDSPGKSGHNQARKFSMAWRDDEWSLSSEYNTVQTNFNPETGFIRRGNATQYSGDAAWQPRLRNSRTIRNLTFATNADYYEGGSSGRVETRTQGGNFGIQFQNGGSINFNVDQTFDRLVKEFRIRPTIPIAAGDYKYVAYSARFTSNQARKIAGTGNLSVGDFWNGTRKSAGGGLTVRPNYHLNVQVDYSRDRVELPDGSFTTNLVGARFLYGFSPRAFLNAFFQYNTDTHQVSSNIRFNIIHHPLSDLYLVYNDRRDVQNGLLMERAFIVKLTNLFNF